MVVAAMEMMISGRRIHLQGKNNDNAISKRRSTETCPNVVTDIRVFGAVTGHVIIASFGAFVPVNECVGPFRTTT